MQNKFWWFWLLWWLFWLSMNCYVRKFVILITIVGTACLLRNGSTCLQLYGLLLHCYTCFISKQVRFNFFENLLPFYPRFTFFEGTLSLPLDFAFYLGYDVTTAGFPHDSGPLAKLDPVGFVRRWLSANSAGVVTIFV